MFCAERKIFPYSSQLILIMVVQEGSTDSDTITRNINETDGSELAMVKGRRTCSASSKNQGTTASVWSMRLCQYRRHKHFTSSFVYAARITVSVPGTLQNHACLSKKSFPYSDCECVKLHHQFRKTSTRRNNVPHPLETIPNKNDELSSSSVSPSLSDFVSVVPYKLAPYRF